MGANYAFCLTENEKKSVFFRKKMKPFEAVPILKFYAALLSSIEGVLWVFVVKKGEIGEEV
jgi:hypothetical protein